MNIKALIANGYMRGYRFLHGIKKDTVTFCSFGGISYSDNPKAISEKIHLLESGLSIQWVIKNADSKKNVLPDYVKLIEANNRFSVWNAMATTEVLVVNSTLGQYPKSKKQFFIQTWHGDRGFKKCLKESEHAKSGPMMEEREGYCNLAVAGSTFGEGVYRRAFGYNGLILKCGCPRNDILMKHDENKCVEIKRKINIDCEKKILLYAPTLRRVHAADKTAQEVQDINLSETVNLLEEQTNCKWLVLLRAHPSISSLHTSTSDDRIIDVSKYEDMADLLSISDFLITDYSSSAGDFALCNKPIILYQSDRQEFLKVDRSFYFDIDKSPFMVAKSQEDVEKIILSLSEDVVKQNCKEILDFYGAYETGNASEAVAKAILEWCRR